MEATPVETYTTQPVVIEAPPPPPPEETPPAATTVYVDEGVGQVVDLMA
jgi:hypothetical protein